MQWLIWLILLCPPSWAEKELTQEEKDIAADKFLNGQVLFEEKEYDRAIKMWQEGYEISGKTGFLKNIAIAQEAKGDYNAAIETVFTLLEKADEDEEREFLRGWIKELKEKQKIAEEQANQEELAKQRAEEEELEKQRAEEQALAEQRAKEQALAEQKAEEEKLAKENEAEQKNDNSSKAKPIYIAWGSTIALASGTGLLWASLDTDLPSGCAAYADNGSSWLCMETADSTASTIQENINSQNSQKTWSQVMTVTTVASTGISIWLTSRYFAQRNFGQPTSNNTPVRLSVTPTGLTLQGEF